MISIKSTFNLLLYSGITAKGIYIEYDLKFEYYIEPPIISMSIACSPQGIYVSIGNKVFNQISNFCNVLIVCLYYDRLTLFGVKQCIFKVQLASVRKCRSLQIIHSLNLIPYSKVFCRRTILRFKNSCQHWICSKSI